MHNVCSSPHFLSNTHQAPDGPLLRRSSTSAPITELVIVMTTDDNSTIKYQETEHSTFFKNMDRVFVFPNFHENFIIIRPQIPKSMRPGDKIRK
jgi:hypothetical protein